MEVKSAPPAAGERRLGPLKVGRDMKETLAGSSLDKIKELEYKIKKMMEEKNELLNGRSETDQMEDHLPSIGMVIAFVESLEKANQYYDFQDFLIQDINRLADSHRDRVFDSIVSSQVRKERFEKVDDKVIQRAIDMRLSIALQIQEVRSRFAFRKRLVECDTITRQSSFVEDIEAVGSFELYPGLRSEELEIEVMKYKLRFNLSPRSQKDWVTKNIYMEKNKKELKRDLAIFEQEKDDYADAYTTYNIVFLSRQGKYVMDHDPRAELEKLLRLHPLLYGFLDLEVSKMMKSDQESLVEYNQRPKICSQEVRVEVADSCPPPSETEEYSEYLSEGNEAASGVEILEAFESNMFEKALKKYNELIKCYERLRQGRLRR